MVFMCIYFSNYTLKDHLVNCLLLCIVCVYVCDLCPMHELTNTIFRIHRYQELWGVWNLPYLQAYKLDGCNFINAGRIQEIPESETKDLKKQGVQRNTIKVPFIKPLVLNRSSKQRYVEDLSRVSAGLEKWVLSLLVEPTT